MTASVRRLFTDDELAVLAQYFEGLRDHMPIPRAETKRVVRIIAELRQARAEIQRLHDEKARLLQRVMDAESKSR